MFREPDVSREVKEASTFFKKLPELPKVAVFASSSLSETDSSWPIARDLGKVLQNAGLLVLTGGREGLMGAVIEGANSGGDIRGIPLFCRPGEPCGESSCGGFVFGHFSLRKQFFLSEAKGVIVLPGGFGTLDELFFWMAFSKVERSYRVPAVFLEDRQRPFWFPLWKTLSNSLIERGVQGDASPHPAVAFSAEEVLSCLGISGLEDGRVSDFDGDQRKSGA